MPLAGRCCTLGGRVVPRLGRALAAPANGGASKALTTAVAATWQRPGGPTQPTPQHSRSAHMAAAAPAASGAGAEVDAAAMDRLRQLIPQLGGNYKGAHGKVAVVGGCLEFTGAPYFAAMSALRVGADMAYVICTPSAATPIKSYSPELMVLPYLPEGQAPDGAAAAAADRIAPWLARATAVVVGPGLGDDPATCAAAVLLIRQARQLGLPLVVDGSALTHIVAQDPSVVAGYTSCLLTPNVAELGRIAAAAGCPLPGRMSDAWLVHAPRVAQAFNGPVVLAKGDTDLVCMAGQRQQGPAALQQGGGQAQAGSSGGEPQTRYRCAEPGALRRCGGQGDVLAGTVAAFLSWAAKQHPQEPGQPASAAAGSGSSTGQDSQAQQQQQQQHGRVGAEDVALCAYGACRVMRGAAAEAYAASERSMVAGEIIPHLYPSFKKVMGCR